MAFQLFASERFWQLYSELPAEVQPLAVSDIPVPQIAIRDKVAPMRWLILLAASAFSVFAQLAPPNDSGISMGHVHLYAADPDAQKKLWVDLLGAQVTHAGTLELLKFPGILVVVAKARNPTTGGAEGSTGT